MVNSTTVFVSKVFKHGAPGIYLGEEDTFKVDSEHCLSDAGKRTTETIITPPSLVTTAMLAQGSLKAY